MKLEVIGPASLPLGIVPVEHEGRVVPCLAGVTLQHPPIHIIAERHQELLITGARADRAYEHAAAFVNYHHTSMRAELQIELAIPSFMGLGSDALLGLCVAQSLAWSNNLPLDDTLALARAIGLDAEYALEIWGFDQGGLLLVDADAIARGTLPPILRRQTIEHPDKKAWVFVMVFPRVPPETPKTFERDHLRALLDSRTHLDRDALPAGRAFWSAAENDNLPAFAEALRELQQINQHIFKRAGVQPETTTIDRQTFDIMRDHGALVWGKSAAGMACYALIEGARASIDLRTRLRADLGPFGGAVMAAIASNTGARSIVKEAP